jgi:hypothetical protein
LEGPSGRPKACISQHLCPKKSEFSSTLGVPNSSCEIKNGNLSSQHPCRPFHRIRHLRSDAAFRRFHATGPKRQSCNQHDFHFRLRARPVCSPTSRHSSAVWKSNERLLITVVRITGQAAETAGAGNRSFFHAHLRTKTAPAVRTEMHHSETQRFGERYPKSLP